MEEEIEYYNSVKHQPIIGMDDMDYLVLDSPQYRDWGMTLLKKYLDAEDEAIMKGMKL